MCCSPAHSHPIAPCTGCYFIQLAVSHKLLLSVFLWAVGVLVVQYTAVLRVCAAVCSLLFLGASSRFGFLMRPCKCDPVDQYGIVDPIHFHR